MLWAAVDMIIVIRCCFCSSDVPLPLALPCGAQCGCCLSSHVEQLVLTCPTRQLGARFSIGGRRWGRCMAARCRLRANITCAGLSLTTRQTPGPGSFAPAAGPSALRATGRNHQHLMHDARETGSMRHMCKLCCGVPFPKADRQAADYVQSFSARCRRSQAKGYRGGKQGSRLVVTH